MSQQSSKYRPDIDGLRALAIAGVLVFHIDPLLLSGGYVGVDVFFVISGFLITSILHRNLASGSFSFADFYERRILRIFPAFLIVLLATLVVGYLMLLPEDLSSLSRSAVHSVASISNILFYRERLDYYNSDFDLNPLIHTWSLGIEEQFYLTLPVLLVVSMKFFKSTRSLIIFLSVLFAVSLGASAYYIQLDPMRSFFLMPYRAWELLLGSLLALVGPRAVAKRAGNILGFTGLALILVSMNFYSEDTPFPGPTALLPCIGTAILIFVGQSPGVWATRFLSAKPLVGLGLISYSVYLWHWPLIAFSKYSTSGIPGGAPTLLAGSIALGALSWRWVEKPFRRSGRLRRKHVFSSWATLSLSVIAVGFGIEASGGFPGRLSKEVTSILDFKKAPEVDAEKLNGKSKKGTFYDSDFDFLATPKYGEQSGEPSFVLWGDSFAGALRPLIETLAKEKEMSFYSFGLAGVAPILGIVPHARKAYKEKVLQYSEKIVEHICSNPSLKTVILEANWVLYIPDKKRLFSWRFFNGKENDSARDIQQEQFFASQLKLTVGRFLDAGKTVVIVYPLPRPICKVPEYLARFSIAGQPLPATVEREDFHVQESVVSEAMDSLPRNDKILRVYPDTILSSNGEVRIMSGDKPLFRDARHISIPGALYLRDLFEPLFLGF